MNRSMLGAIVALALVGGCDFYPEAEDTLDTAPEVTGPPLLFVEDYVVPGLQGLPDDERTPDAHAATLGAEPTPVAVHVGWPGSDSSRCLSVVWSTDVDTLSSLVELKVAGEDEVVSLEGVSFTYGATNQFRSHEWKSCSTVQPSTAYQYRVGGEGAWSEWFDYSSPAEPGTFDTFTVGIAGDSRGAYEDWAQVVAKMETHDPDFYLFSGDMVENGVVQAEWVDWWGASGTTFASKPFIPSHGNHEYLATNYFAQFSLPGDERWFSVHYGDLSVVSLDDLLATEEQRLSLGVAALDDGFTESPGHWKFAMHHAPIYSTCTRHGSNEGLREDWEADFERHGVDAVLAGHNHIYERSVPIRAGEERSPGDGTVYLVSGGAGAPLYEESEADWFNAVANPVEHYIIAEFGPDEIQFVVRDLADNVIDSFSIPR